MNCLNGIFNPIFGEDDGASLAEAMQRAPQGGAVAVWASSSSTPPATQALVNQELFRLIFSGAYATLGEAVAAAKAGGDESRLAKVVDLLRRSGHAIGGNAAADGLAVTAARDPAGETDRPRHAHARDD